MGVAAIKKELKKLEKDQIINLIADLYKKNNSVKEFFDFYVDPNEPQLFKKYHNKVYEAFYPKRGFGLKLKDGKQAISDFKRMGTSAHLVADLTLFYVETGVQFTKEFGDIDEDFYSSLESTYVQALTFMRKEDLLGLFADRAKKVVDDTNDIGWGFHDYLAQIYEDFYDIYE